MQPLSSNQCTNDHNLFIMNLLKIKYFSCLLLWFLYLQESHSQITAITEDGKAVMLFSNGSWRYLNDSVMVSGLMPISLNTPPGATEKIKNIGGDFEIWFNPRQWKILPESLYENAEYSFEHIDGELIALVIAEKIQVPLQKMKAAAVENFNKTATEYKITEEQNIQVNGTDGLLLKIDALVDGVPFAYLNAYFSTAQGTFQVMSFTGYNLFDRYRKDMTDLISGFVMLTVP
jgi:hypothetical protein